MSKFLTPPVWYDKNGNLVEILTGISKDGGVGIGKDANAGSGAVVIGNNGLTTNESNGDNRVWIGYTATRDSAVINMKSVVIGTIRTWEGDYSGSDGMTVPNSVLIGGNIYHQFPYPLSVNGSTIINSHVTASIDNGELSDVIAIGCQSGHLGASSDYIQIGSSNKTYSAQIGDGNGILKCRALEVAPVSYGINQYLNSASSTISYPDNFILEQHGVYEFVFTVNGGLQTVPIVFSGTKTDTVKTYFNLSYGDKDSDDMIIYGSVMWGENGIRLTIFPLATPSADFIKIYIRYIVYLGSFQNA